MILAPQPPCFPSASTGFRRRTFRRRDQSSYPYLYVANYIDLDRVDAKARCRYFAIDVFCGPNGLPGSPDRLYHNRSGLAFADVTEEAGVYRPDTRGFSVLFIDLNFDRLPEIHVANDATTDLLFENKGGMRFEDISLRSGAGYSASGVEQSGMGSTAGDYDGDSDFDLYVTNFQRDYNTMFRNEGGLFFQDVTVSSGLGLPTLDRLSWGTHSLDVDFDGDLDLFVANGHIYPELVEHPEIGEPYAQENQLFLNDGRGRFSEARLADRSIRRVGRGTAVGDLDGDGASDVVVNNLDDVPDVYRGALRKHSLAVSLVGTSSNRDGPGALVRVRSDGANQVRKMRLSDGYLGSNEPVVRFGLGDAVRVDSLEVEWPSGARTRCEGVEGGSLVRVKEGGDVFLDPRGFPARAGSGRGPGARRLRRARVRQDRSRTGRRKVSDRTLAFLSQLQVMTDAIPQAAQSLARALELAPEQYRWRTTLGALYYRLGKLDEAERELDQVLRQSSPVPIARYYLAAAYKARGELARAEEHARLAVEQMPQEPVAESLPRLDFSLSVNAMYLLAEIQAERGGDVEDLLRRTLANEPTHPAARYLLARSLLKRGRLEEERAELAAFDRAKRALEHVQQGLDFGRAANQERAVAEYRRGLEIYPDHPRALYFLARELASTGRKEEAERLLEVEPGAEPLVLSLRK